MRMDKRMGNTIIACLCIIEMSRMYIRILSLLFAVALITVAYGKEKLEAFETEMGEQRITVAKNANHTYAELSKINLVICRNAIKSRDFDKISFLVKGIKYSCIESNETLVFENSNQRIVYFLPLSVCIYYVYNSEIGTAKYDNSALEALAKKAVYSAFSNFKGFIITKAELVSDDEKVCTYAIMTTLTGEKSIVISLRKDTGSVILYDVRDALDIISESIGLG